MKRVISLVIAISVGTAAGAQSLADVAKKEKERRKQVDSAESLTVTDVELRRAGGPRTSLPATTTSSADADDADSTGDADLEEDEEEVVDERQNEAYWRGRLDPINTRINTMETRLQGPEFTSNPIGGADRQRLEQQIAKARAERQAVIDEARRKGVPPGWLR